MRFLADACVDVRVAEWLRRLGRTWQAFRSVKS